MTPKTTTPFAIYGTIIHSANLTTIDIIPNTLLLISATGNIICCDPNTTKRQIPAALAVHGQPSDFPITYLSDTQFLTPGFIDTHNHAPQWSQRGLGRNLDLLTWLEKITFPHESRFADPIYARTTYESCVEGFLKQGITTASYYGSRHGPATKILVDVCVDRGQRAFVGRCNMDRHAPETYVDSGARESVDETREFVEYVRSLQDHGKENGLVTAVLTPRFAISCSSEVLSGLGQLASHNPTLPIQTHFNESQGEMAFTKQLYPSFQTEAELYEHFGLLTKRTILAHAIYPEASEITRIAEVGCGIAHCPTPNVTMGTFMVAPVREYLRRGIAVGLGTDSGGGYSSSMLEVMKAAFVVSTARHTLTEGKDEILSLDEGFYLSTVGGAHVLGLEDKIGKFAVGMEFDACLVDAGVVGGVMAPVEEEDGPRGMLEKWLMTGDDRNIVRVWVKGRAVKDVLQV